MRGLALSLAFAPLSPWLLLQGLRVRRDTPRLHPACGPTHGTCSGPAQLRPLRLLAIGESTVAGVGTANHEEALTGQLARQMARLTGRGVAWVACGLSGASVATARTALLPQVARERVDLLLLVFGVNDVLEHTRPARYAKDLQALIGGLRERVGNASALIAAAPPMGRFPSLPRPLNVYLGARAALLNGATRKLAIGNAAQVAPLVGIEPALIATDGIHPSAAGYAVWALSLARAAIDQGFIKEARCTPTTGQPAPLTRRARHLARCQALGADAALPASKAVRPI